jgi:hypothetical protein
MNRSPRLPAGTHAAGELLGPMVEFQAAVVRLDHVDPVTTELVRLRCANHHDCHT